MTTFEQYLENLMGMKKAEIINEGIKWGIWANTEGNKAELMKWKKVLLARSLCEPSHLLVWDEPLNYVDVLSRIQLEELLLEFKPAILFVEHDRMFCEHVATKTVTL